MDDDNDLFQPFHLMITNAVLSVAESYLSDLNPFTVDNSQLLLWNNCSFTGKETWVEVKKLLRPRVTRILEYLRFVLVIPGMKSFLRIMYQQENDRFILCPLMSLECFMQYNRDNYCHLDLDVDVCGFTAYSLANGCERCQDNYNMVFSECLHHSKCTYYNNICPNYGKISISRDQDAVDKEVLEAAVIHMYRYVIDGALDGNLGVHVPPPKIKYKRQMKKKDSIMLCEFINLVNDEYFMLWLNKLEAVEVSKIAQFLVTQILLCHFFVSLLILCSIVLIFSTVLLGH